MRWYVGLLVALTAAKAPAADPWHTDLFLSGHDTWHARIPVDVANTSRQDLAGFPVAARVGEGANEVPLVGAQARAVRVCDAPGTEMLFDLRGPDGQRVENGPVPPGSTLTLPLTASAGGTQRLYVYYDNPEAYLLPEYLAAQASASNGGFEVGEGTVPEGWRFTSGDAQHTMAWVNDRPHGGARCVRVEVSAGAEARWVTVQQSDLAVRPGQRYRVTAWVRGEGVVGQAGWYVHVATPDDPQAINQVEKAGDGSFDWRQAAIKFTAPEDATSLSHGTILYGTGTAWFDDATVECLDAAPAGPAVAVRPTERLELRRIGLGADYLRTGARTWNHRAPITTINVGEALGEVLVRAPAAPFGVRLARGFNPKSLRIVDPLTGRVLPHIMLGDELVFRGEMPARCIKAFGAYLDRESSPTDTGQIGYATLVESAANLVRNGSFEGGDSQPTDWAGMAEGAGGPTAEMERVTGGRIGEHCVRLTVTPEEPQRWTGWKQEVRVEPSTEYVFMAYARTEGISGGKVRVHAHLQGREEGKTLQMWSGGPDLTGTTGWTLLGGRLRTTPETERLVLYLTMNAAGTVYHDGVLLARTVPATVGEFERRPLPNEPPLHVWTENPIVKVFQDTPPGNAPARIELFASRGEQESLQLCLRSRQAMRAVKVTVDTVRSGEEALPGPRIERVGFVPCLEPSGFFRSEAPAWERKKPNGPNRNDGWRGWWPDYLVPIDGSLSLEAERTQPLWLTFAVPREAKPGTYRAVLRVTSPGAPGLAVPLVLRVGRFQLPERPTLQVLLDLRNGPGWSLYDTPRKLEQWWRFMAAHRISADHILPEPKFALLDGRVAMEATEFDRAAQFYFDQLHMAAAYFPSVLYSFGWGHSPRPFLALKYPTPEYEQAYQAAVKLFWEHVKAKGWSDRFSLYVSDEPHYQRPEVVANLAAVIRLTREVDPSIPVYASTWGHVPEWDGVLNHWGIGQYGVFPLETLRERRAAGDKVWFTTDGQFELDTPYNACERLLPYYCFAHDVSGYEFWALPWYTYDPFRFGWYSFLFHSFSAEETSWDRYPNGSGYLAYPGEPLGVDGPLSSIRLEQVREGIEDYEVLVALQRLMEERPEVKDRIQPVLTEAQALAPIPNAGGYRSTEILPDPDALVKVRLRAAELLEGLVVEGQR